MKFILNESIDNNIWYHASLNDFDMFKPNRQGIHFGDSIEACKYVLKNRNGGNLPKYYYIYTCEMKNELIPLYIDADPMDWGGVTLAKLLKAKIGNTEFEGASGDNDKDGNNYKYNLSPDLIHIDTSKFTKGDISTIKLVASWKEKENDSSPFNIIINIIKQQGYNCIIYPLAEDKSNKAKALILFDNKLCKIIDKEFIENKG